MKIHSLGQKRCTSTKNQGEQSKLRHLRHAQWQASDRGDTDLCRPVGSEKASEGSCKMRIQWSETNNKAGMPAATRWFTRKQHVASRVLFWSECEASKCHRDAVVQLALQPSIVEIHVHMVTLLRSSLHTSPFRIAFLYPALEDLTWSLSHEHTMIHGAGTVVMSWGWLGSMKFAEHLLLHHHAIAVVLPGKAVCFAIGP